MIRDSNSLGPECEFGISHMHDILNDHLYCAHGWGKKGADQECSCDDNDCTRNHLQGRKREVAVAG